MIKLDLIVFCGYMIKLNELWADEGNDYGMMNVWDSERCQLVIFKLHLNGPYAISMANI